MSLVEVSVTSNHVVVTWQLEAPVPDSLGSTPGWGKISGGWSLGLPQFDESGEGFQVTLLLEKIEDEWFASIFNTEEYDDGLFYRRVDVDTITFDGSRITVPYPIRGFPEFPGAFTFCGESDTFVPTGGAENPFAGFWITDEVCGTFERPTPFPG